MRARSSSTNVAAGVPLVAAEAHYVSLVYFITVQDCRAAVSLLWTLFPSDRTCFEFVDSDPGLADVHDDAFSLRGHFERLQSVSRTP